MATSDIRADGSLRPWIIYLLSDPRDGEVRYVGKAFEQRGARQRQSSISIASHRLNTHVYYAKRQTGTHRLHWIRSLLDAGVNPVITVVVDGEGPGCSETEIRWIAVGRSLGLRLTNGTDGGEGASGRKASDEMKAKISAANKGKRRKHSEETKKKIGDALRGKPIARERIEKLTAAKLGKRRPIELVERSAAFHRGRKRSAETRAKISAALSGRKLSVEHKAALSELRKRRIERPKPQLYTSKAKLTAEERSAKQAKLAAQVNKARGTPESVQREALRLYFEEHLTAGQVATALSISKGAVRGAVNREYLKLSPEEHVARKAVHGSAVRSGERNTNYRGG